MLAIAVTTAVTLPFMASGCETFVESEDCDPSAAANPTIVYDGGIPDSPCAYASSADGPSGSPYDGEYLLFNGGAHYALEHHLACTPVETHAYLSFDEYGNRTGSEVSPAAGDQFIITKVDDKYIYVSNSACADYWLLVTASVDPSTCAACRN